MARVEKFEQENEYIPIIKDGAGVGRIEIGTTIPHIYYHDYGNEELYITSYSEQTQIGTFLSTLDHLIITYQRKVENNQMINKL
ncbi:hypothetical protein I4Q36_06610 [Tuanshanicoccus lijuaniae]|uniref:hypothetical protein n=1 Tax=Aerococcaceae bacterium zg-1292 TaxID=2774330 RepID=UPI001935E4D8|nr:hypothetical protein [Aerococcaceae bacterium zg-1292]QQA36486.1 hypothetical protein I4Q36_06610 [Aerococcaceae bacterium zg-1292]